MKKKLAYIGMASLLLSFTACESGTNEFPDFDYQTVYFASQYGLRTLELGEDEFADNSLDNQHKCVIKAAWGGGYTNRNNVIIDFIVDNALCDNLYFKGTNNPVKVMPANYYSLASNQINIPKGEVMGGVEVQFTDAFFEDPLTTDTTYVIPLRMTDVQGADSILQGKADVENPILQNANHWTKQPKNFVLYAVKYVNPWHGEYLRRGIDQAMINGEPKEIVRHAQYVEKDEVVKTSTQSLKDNILSLSTKDAAGQAFNYQLKLTFDDNNQCSVTAGSDNVSATGTGKFVKRGDKNSLGGKDRDVIYLDYSVEFLNKNMQYATKDTLVLRTRGVQGGAPFEVEYR